MRKIYQMIAIATAFCMAGVAPVWADGEHHLCNHTFKKTSDNFFPAFRLVLTPELVCDNFGFAALGEIGSKNFRGNGTVGLFLCDRHRLKFSSEFLGQKLHYKFRSGSIHHWVHQWAVGGTYQYRFDNCNNWCGCQYIDGFQLHGFYSKAEGHRLHAIECPRGHFDVLRHIDAGKTYVIEAGAIVTPCDLANVILSIGYDHTRYNRHFHHHHKELSGVGGSIEVGRCFCNEILFNFKAEFRRPYNYIEALLGWNRAYGSGEVYVGLFGSHTFGKCELPSSSAAGLELRYAFGVESCWNSCCGSCDNTNCVCTDPCLADWLARPAVYMPEVLAIAEEAIRTICPDPTATKIANFCTFEPFGDFTYDVSSAFDGHGKEIKFSQTGIPSEVGGIDPETGIILVHNSCLDKIFNVTVTGTTTCGSVSRTFKLDLPCKK